MWILATAIALAPALGFTSILQAAGLRPRRIPPYELTRGDPAAPLRSFGLASHRSLATQKPKVHTVVIDKAAFSDTPAGVKISAGDIVEWVNLDIFDHTTTSKAGGWDVVIPAGKKARVTMKTAGTFDYFCKYHPNMTGRVAVVK